MDQIKKNQHYVWQYYLKAWADVKRVTVINVDTKKEFPANTERICQESFFYEGKNLSKSAFDNMKNLLVNFAKRTKKEEDVCAVLSDIDLHIIDLTILLDLKEHILSKEFFQISDIINKEYVYDYVESELTINEKNCGPLLTKIIAEKYNQNSIIKNRSIIESFESIDISFNQAIISLDRFTRHLIDSNCPSSDVVKFLDEYIKRLNKDLIENLHDKYEQFSIKYLDELRLGTAKFFDDQQSKIEFINFLSLQLGRTKKTFDSFQNNVIPSMNNFGRELNESETELLTNIAELKPYYYFFQSRYLTPYLDKFLNKLIVLFSDGSLDFITSDQPVVPINTESALKDFQIYYPISPKIAILLSHTDTIKPIVEQDILTDVEIYNWNLLMEKQCKTYIVKTL